MPWCKECKQECDVIDVDFGIGAYEYWGAKGVHVDIQAVSDCCEGDWTEDEPEDEEGEDENG